MTRYLFMILMAALFFACGGTEGTEVESSDAEAVADVSNAAGTYAVDLSGSNVEWNGTKLIGGGHTGTIPLSDGQIMVDESGNIVGGRFTMDVTGLQNTDLAEEDGRDKLVGHLKSEDFFNVAEHPTASFEITRVQPIADNTAGPTHDITGNLTLKGNSRSVTIPTTVTMEGDMIKASTPQFVIDRTEWGMEYGSGSIAGIAQDNIINDEVGLQLYLVANKQ